MNNTELIDSLDDQRLLCLVELLSQVLMVSADSIRCMVNKALYYDLPIEVVDYCEYLNGYQRLKLMQLAIDTLVAEAEKPAIPVFQLALPFATQLKRECSPTTPTNLRNEQHRTNK